jgi:hypothetical protein
MSFAEWKTYQNITLVHRNDTQFTLPVLETGIKLHESEKLQDNITASGGVCTACLLPLSEAAKLFNA